MPVGSSIFAQMLGVFVAEELAGSRLPLNLPVMRPPEVILFDAAGTLIHLSRGAGWHYADVARRHGWVVEAEAMEEAFRTEWKRAEPPADSAGPRLDDDRGWWEALVCRVVDRVEAPAFDRGAYFRELWNEFALPGVWTLFPEVREVISQIANHYRLGMISNFDSRLYTILRHVGLAHFFEHVVVSSEVGADKPARRIFEEALDRFDARPDEVIHVGDEPEADWRGAREAGLRVFELRRPEITLRELLVLLEQS